MEAMKGVNGTYAMTHPSSDRVQSESLKTSPLTPRGPRRPAAILNGHMPYPNAAQEDVLTTPRKKISKERTGRSTTSRASSSPMKCSPGKRHLHVSSSSSPSRDQTRRDGSRPARRRSRTSSVTTILVEGLASVRCQEECASDGAIIMTEETLSPMLYDDTELKAGKEKDSNSLFGTTAIQAMKIGFSKYTPLLKVLSEPWRGESGKADRNVMSTVATPIRGHRRSTAWHDKKKSLHQQDVEIAALGRTYANREKANLYLDSLVSKSNTQTELSTDSKARRGRAGQTSPNQTGALEYNSSRSASLPRRANKKTWSPLDVLANGGTATTQAVAATHLSPILACSEELNSARESDMMNRQTSLSQEAWQSILKGESCSPASDKTLAVPSSSMPSIIVTPPTSTSTAQAQPDVPSLSFADTNVALDAKVQSEDIDMAMHDADKVDQLEAKEGSAMKPGVQASCHAEAVYTVRQHQDEQGLALYKATIDKLLSEYFAYRSAKRTGKLARQIIDFLQEVIQFKEGAIVNDNSKYAPYRQRELPVVSIPSLQAGRCQEIDKSGKVILLSFERVSRSYQSALNIVLDHLVTGLIALVTDNRAPYETPQALSQLCMALQCELPLAISAPRIFSEERGSKSYTSPELPLTGWVEACVPSMHDSPDTHLRQLSDSNADKEELQWTEFLRSTNPSAIFVRLIDSTVNNILERGEDIRLKANLLAVPPPRKGSRKRWMMATAEITQRRVARDKALNEVTRGIITESQYRKLERQWAVIGNPKDSFAGLTLVRFIGELSVSQLLDVHAIRKWLFRFFINTVFPNVPSSYELEAGCALLITVGEALDKEAGLLSCCEESPAPSSSPEAAVNVKRARRVAIRLLSEDDIGMIDSANDPNADDWTFVKSKSSREQTMIKTNAEAVSCTSIADEGEEAHTPPGFKQTALDTINSIMKRLEEIIELEEIDNESRAWICEIIALRKRNWQQGHAQDSCQGSRQ